MEPDLWANTSTTTEVQAGDWKASCGLGLRDQELKRLQGDQKEKVNNALYAADHRTHISGILATLNNV